jgi:hypothetical protein
VVVVVDRRTWAGLAVQVALGAGHLQAVEEQPVLLEQ